MMPDAYWNYAILEIYDWITACYRKKADDLKRSIIHDFIMAEVKARYILGSKDRDVPHPWEYYEELFDAEKQQYEKRKEQEEYEAYKEARKAYIEEFNRRRQQSY